jgi:hypothetical protein
MADDDNDELYSSLRLHLHGRNGIHWGFLRLQYNAFRFSDIMSSLDALIAPAKSHGRIALADT